MGLVAFIDGGGAGAALCAGMFSGGVCACRAAVGEKAERVYSGIASPIKNAREKGCCVAGLKDFGSLQASRMGSSGPN